MIKRILAGAAVAALLAAGAAKADTVDFDYSLQGVDQAVGSFSFANGSTGVLGYGDLTAFSITVSGATYDLADVLPLTDYVHFAYDTGSNTFLVAATSCGFAGCNFQPSLSAINSSGSFGFFFTGVPGGYAEYSTGFNGPMDKLVLSAASSGTPEPAAWALMLVGFGGMGAALRAARRRAAALA